MVPSTIIIPIEKDMVMARFRGAVITCEVCGREARVPPSRAKTARFCSTACAAVVRNAAMRKRVTLNCIACGKPFEERVCHASRRRYCSKDCQHGHAAYLAGLSERAKGANNPLWKGGIVPHPDGYLYERAPDHPLASNGYVLQHRLVMERWLRENDPESPFLIKFGEQLYLSPDFVVHHKDEIKNHNVISNLECLTHAEHRKHHNDVRRRSAAED